MLVDRGLLGALTADPLAGYPAAAALLLASVAIASGLMRGDVLALARPLPLAWCVAALGATWLVQAAASATTGALSLTLAAAGMAPLAVIAVAYGPTPALVTLALVHAWIGVPPYPSAAAGAAGPLLIGLELALLGWLAIAPSPRRVPLLAGVYLLVAHAFTWATAGLAWLVLTHGDLTLAALADTHGLRFGAVAVTAVLLASMTPASWRRAFPGSALVLGRHERVPPKAATPAPAAHGERRNAERRGAARRGESDGPRGDEGSTSGVWDGADLQPWTRPTARSRRPDEAVAPPTPERFVRSARRRGGASRMRR